MGFIIEKWGSIFKFFSREVCNWCCGIIMDILLFDGKVKFIDLVKEVS